MGEDEKVLGGGPLRALGAGDLEPMHVWRRRECLVPVD